MRAIVVALLGVLTAAPAYADKSTDYLQIECDSNVGNFSVRPRFAYVEEGSPKPETWIEVRRGITVAQDNTVTRAPGSDVFASCRLGSLFFEVIRTSVSPPNLCNQGCTTGSARFEVRLNGHVLTEGQVGYAQDRVMDSVTYDSQLFVCQSPNRDFRDEDSQGVSRLECRVGPEWLFLNGKYAQ
jgi:hypothetical protein